MTEKQTHRSEQPAPTPASGPDRDYSKAAKIAAGIVGGTLLVGGVIADNVRRNNIEENVRNDRLQEQEHEQAVLDEIQAKSTDLFVPGEDDTDAMVAFIGTVGDTDLYGQAITLIPEELEDDSFVKYTVIESSKDQGIYQPDDAFGLFTDQIDGRDTLIVRPIDTSVANVEIDPPADF